MERFNNWMWYTYDNLLPNQPKLLKNSKLQLHFNKSYQPKKINYFESLFRNARLLSEIYKGPFDVMLSGGIDSEVIVRVFHELKIPQNVYTFKFENNYNILDVMNAETLCKDLNIKLNLIDFNLEKFFENDAEYYYKVSFPSVIEKLVRFDFYKYMDNIPVVGDGEPYWVRNLWNLPKKSDWSMAFYEHDYAHATYSKAINRTIIGEWYQFTPEIWISFMEIDYVKKLLNDQIPNKLSSWSYRDELHRHLWPGIRNKPKLIGYEGDQNPTKARIPPFMAKFKEEFFQKEEAEFRFTKPILENMFEKNYTVDLDDPKFFKTFHSLKKNYYIKKYETN